MSNTVTVWTREKSRTVEDVVHAQTRFGSENTIVLEHSDGSTTTITDTGASIAGFTETDDDV